MKKILMIVAITSVFAACNNKPKDAALVDTVALKQRAVAEEQAKADEAARVKALDDERNKLEAERNRLAATRRRVANSGSSGSSSNVGASTVAPATGSGTATEAPAKKGWSDAAKGTAIGAAAGAVGGMLLDKNDARGAIIGGVVGAGTGYVIGRAKDRKTGRVVPKTKPPQQ